MTMFVTGAAGFIGAAMTRRLSSLGLDVHILVKRSSNLWRLEDIKDKVTIHYEDITDRVQLQKLLGRLRPTGIFHFAARGAYAGVSDISEMTKVNIGGTVSLLEASNEIPYKIFINIGSSAEYGIRQSAMRESDTLEPMNLYAATKASSTIIAQTYARLYHKPIVTIRPFTVYGPYEAPFRFIPTIIRSTLSQNQVSLTKDVIRHDFIYIDDFVDACIKALEKGSSLSGEIINVGTGKEFTNDQVVDMIFRTIRKKTRVTRAAFPKRAWDNTHWVADVSRSKRLLGWRATTSLAMGIKKTYIWFAAHRDIYANLSKTPT